MNPAQRPMIQDSHENAKPAVKFNVARYANWLHGVIFAVLAIVVSHASALDTNDYAKHPISIEADSATQDEQQGTITYSGNVKITQLDVLITADQVRIYRNLETTANAAKVEKIVASGSPARFAHHAPNYSSPLTAEGNSIHYDLVSGVVKLETHALLAQQGSSVSGDMIQYRIADQKIIAAANPSDKNARVKTVILPGENNVFNINN